MAIRYTAGGGNGIKSSTSGVTTYSATADGSGNASIDNLLAGAVWGNGLGGNDIVRLTVSYSTANSVYRGGAAPSPVQTFAPAQIEAARKAMALLSAVCNVQFEEVVDSRSVAGDIRWGQSGNATAVPTAYAMYPSTQATGGDIWIGPNYPSYKNPVEGGYAFYIYTHELGHAMGLNHVHEGSVAARPGEDSVKYSVMSYRDFAGDDLGSIASKYLPTTYMINDIAALQFLYGANMNHRTGDDVYSWAANRSVYETIWDAGGNDTIDASNQAQGVKIDLNPGQWSEIGVAFDNSQAMVRDTLTIAYGATIENAIGSAHDDRLIGNAVANALTGGAGNDILDGNGGNDVLTGGDGSDVFVFDTALGALTNLDRITDFSVVDDLIQLSRGVFTALADAGSLAAAHFRTGSAQDGDDYILYDSSTGVVSYDADGNGAIVPVGFVQLAAGLALTSGDFLVA